MISVITGAYNHVKTLPILFESLKSQTYKNFEWLIADDGSDDGTWEYIRSIASYKKFTIEGIAQTKKGMRLGRSLNNAIRRSQGNIIFTVMGDSYLNLDTLEVISKDFITGSIGSGVRRNVNEDGTFNSWDWRISDELLGNVISISNNERPYALLTGNSLISDRGALFDIGLWAEEYEGYGRDDWAVFLRAHKKGIPLYMYNTVIINHFAHKGTVDVPENIARFEKELV